MFWKPTHSRMSTAPPIPENVTEVEQTACNICGSGETRQLFRKWTFRIVQCVKCGLVYVTPHAFRIEADDYFEGPYLSTIETDGKLKAGIGMLYGEIVYRLGQRGAKGKLLDVGCAMGHFLDFAKRYGWEVEGVECSPYAARYAEDRFGVRVHPVCKLEDAHLQEKSYNSCVLVEVIEHLPDPRATMTEVFRVLRPGGLAYVTTPNFASYRSMLLREEWNAVIPMGHLYHFDAASLERLLTSIGFTEVEDLTGAAKFSDELDFARKSGLFKLSDEELARIEEIARRDAESGPANGRDEGLMMCARKPGEGGREPVARDTFVTPYEGCLVRRPGETSEDQMVFFIENGRKRWVTTAEWIVAKGMNWPGDVQFITAEELDAMLPGPRLP